MSSSAKPLPATEQPSVRPVARPPRLRQASLLIKISMVVFTLGVLAIAADFALFASGHHDLPLWLNLCALLAPVGFGIGLVGVWVEARRKPPTRPAA